MGQAEIIIDMIPRQLLASAVLVFTHGAHPSPHRGDLLTDIKIAARDKGRMDLPTARRTHLFDSCKSPKQALTQH